MKLQIRETLDINWTDALDGSTKAAAIAWLQSNVPDGATLDLEYDYESIYGCAYYIRDETDAEEEARLAKERAEVNERLARERLLLESNIERMERIKGEDLALYIYLTKHKGNPNIGDLENLFKTAMVLERDGKVGTASNLLWECMARLENV